MATKLVRGQDKFAWMGWNGQKQVTDAFAA
jgi:hypothetical protein